MTQLNYHSEYNGDLRVHDTNARQFLSDYAYQKLWHKNIEMKARYQFKISSDGKHNIVWPIGEDLSLSNRHTYPLNGRCGCDFQVTWLCPCAHEFTVKVSFDVEHYSSRWLCTTKFEEFHQELIPMVCTHPVDTLNIDVTESDIKKCTK